MSICLHLELLFFFLEKTICTTNNFNALNFNFKSNKFSRTNDGKNAIINNFSFQFRWSIRAVVGVVSFFLFDVQINMCMCECTLKRVNLNQTFSSHTTRNRDSSTVRQKHGQIVYIRILVPPNSVEPSHKRTRPYTNACSLMRLYMLSEGESRCRFYIVHLGISVQTSSSSLSLICCALC